MEPAEKDRHFRINFIDGLYTSVWSMQLQDTIDAIKVDVFLPMEISLIKLYFRYILMIKQNFAYSYDTMDIS